MAALPNLGREINWTLSRDWIVFDHLISIFTVSESKKISPAARCVVKSKEDNE